MNPAENAWTKQDTHMDQAATTGDTQQPFALGGGPLLQPNLREGLGCRQSSSGINLLLFYQQHQDMLAAQRNLQEGMTEICEKLHSVTHENITLHQRLLEVRRSHKALCSTHEVVVEQLRAVCALNEELEARVQVQAQLLNGYSSGASLVKANGHGGQWNATDLVTMGSCEVDFASLNQLFQESFPDSGRQSPEQPLSEEQQTSGFFGGLDLIGEAIEQMESEERSLEEPLPTQQEEQQQQQQTLKHYQGQAGGGGSDDSGAASAPPFKHSETSTSQHLEPANSQQAGSASFLGIDADLLPEFPLAAALCKSSVLSPPTTRPSRASGRTGSTASTRIKAAQNAVPAKASAASRAGVAAKSKVAKRKKSRGSR